jgi:hypothetical protein
MIDGIGGYKRELGRELKRVMRKWSCSRPLRASSCQVGGGGGCSYRIGLNGMSECVGEV